MDTTHLASKLLERNRVGSLLRIFAPSAETAAYQIASGIATAKKLLALEVGGRKVFARIDFLVSNDQRYEDSDVAGIVQTLRDAVDTEFGDAPVQVLDIKNGDVFCMLLNYGIVNQLEDRIPYSCIISHTAHEYITEENIAGLLASMQRKARVAGLALHNIHDSVMQGRIANTFAIWHNKSLMTVGGFDVRAAKPLKENLCDTVTGICPADAGIYAHKDLQYHIAGCEEIIPLIRMIRNFGPCIAPIEPSNPDIVWGPAEIHDPEGYRRMQAKIATKSVRQEHFARLEGESASFLEKGILSNTA